MTDSDVPTIHAVAREAGVSIGTVSNVLNHPTQVAPQTRERVLQAIARLGYIRNSAARDLVRRRADGIGLIVPDIVNELAVAIARGAQLAAQQRGLSLLLANAVHSFASFDADADADAEGVHTDQQDQYLDYFAEARTAGILLSAMRDPTAGIARIREHVRPIVVVNYDLPDADWCSVLMDNEQAGRLAAEHLAGVGVDRVYFLSVPDVAQPISDRRRGLHQAAERIGLEVIDVPASGLRIEDGRAATSTVLSWEPSGRFAILGVSDALAIGALGVLRTRPHLGVPDRVAVMGLDGDHRGRDTDWLSLTSIELPGYRMGEEAIRLVLDEATAGHRHERVMMPVSIRVGQSTTRAARD